MLCKRGQRLSCKNHYVKVLGSRWPKRCGKAHRSLVEILEESATKSNGLLVTSVEEAAKRIVELVTDKKLRDEMEHKAKDTVRKSFLLTRYLEQHLDLFCEL